MNRSEFLKSIIATVGLSALPKSWLKSYHKLYLLQCFVAGFQYYKGPQLLQKMNEGQQLELVREPNNEFDAEAIALHWNGEKIGFIPASINSVLSRLLDAKALEFHAEITHLHKDAATWENVAIAVYFLKEAVEVQKLDAAHLTILETPIYYSVKSNEQSLTRVEKRKEKEIMVVNINRLPEKYAELSQL